MTDEILERTKIENLVEFLMNGSDSAKILHQLLCSLPMK